MGASSKLSRHQKHVYTLKDNQKYHLFASYSNKDQRIVREFLQALENCGLQINDPDRDFVPGETVFRNIIERGLEISKMFIMFITKNFLSSPWCSYESDLAVWKYITTKGKYRVIPVVLESCKVPPKLKVLNCIHVWKYKMKLKKNETGVDALNFNHMLKERIMKAITSPPLKFRRIRWIGMKAFNRGNNLVQKMRIEVMKDKTREEEITTKTNPFNYLKLLAVIDHCLLHCKYGHCGFSCSGRNFLQFHNHLNTCRYRPTKCKNKQCQHVCPNWELAKHMNECKHTIVHCNYDGCKAVIRRAFLDNHRKVCSFQPVPCPNKESGCEMVIYSKEIEPHLQICDYVEVQCKNCENWHTRKFQEQHLKHCPLNVVKCKSCKTETFQKDLSYHQDRCPMMQYKCQNAGCDMFLTKAQMLVHKHGCPYRIRRCQNLYCGFEGVSENVERHKMECEYRQILCEDCGRYITKKEYQRHQKDHKETVVCVFCKMTFPYSDTQAHKKWLCPRRNFVSQCDICNAIVKFSELEEHKQNHYEKNESIDTYKKKKEAELDKDESNSVGISATSTETAGTSVNEFDSVWSKTDESIRNKGRNVHTINAADKRKKHNSEPNEWFMESLMSIVSEPEIRSPVDPQTLSVNLDNSESKKPCTRRECGSSLKKFRNLWKAIDNCDFKSLYSKRGNSNRAMSSSEFRSFLNSC